MDLKDLFIVILVICILGIFFFGSVGSFLGHVHNAVGEFANDAEAKNEYFSVDYLEGKTDNPYGHSSDSSSYREEASSKDSSPEFLGFSIDQNTHSIKSGSSDSGSYSSGSQSSGSKDSSGYSSGSQSSGSKDSSGSSSSSKESSSQSSKSNGWFPNIIPNIFPDNKADNSNSSNKSIIPSNDTNRSIIPEDTNNSNSSYGLPEKYEDYQINYTTDMVDEEGNPIILTIVSTSGNQAEPGVYKVYWSKLGVINQTKIK